MEEDARNNGCFGVVLFAVLLAAGALVFVHFFLEPISLFLDARRWHRTPCVIITSRLEPAPTTGAAQGGAARGRVDIRYRYTFRGQHYRSSRVWFIKPRAGDTSLLRRYPEGSSAWCYVNPRDPKEAVLERDFKGELLIALAPLAVALTGLVGLLARALRGRPDRRGVEWQWRNRLGRAGPAPAARALPAGEVVWRSPRGLTTFLIFLGFTAFWCFVVSFLVREVIAAWREGVPGCHGLVLTVFAVPFVAAAAVLIGIVVVSFLKLFNPRVELRLSSGRAALGETIDVSWRFIGNASRIASLEVSLEGVEQATYTRGTSRITEREVFRKVNVASTTFGAQIREGSARLTIPADTVPTFTAPNNRIVWELHFRGTIPRWPDVAASFEITVVPAGGNRR